MPAKKGHCVGCGEHRQRKYPYALGSTRVFCTATCAAQSAVADYKRDPCRYFCPVCGSMACARDHSEDKPVPVPGSSADIIQASLKQEPAQTLQGLADQAGITRERVRQIVALYAFGRTRPKTRAQTP